MVRTQIQITDEQALTLKKLARSEGVSMAMLIRRSIDQFVQQRGDVSLAIRKRRALAVVGKYASQDSDVSQEHDRYLTAIYGEVDD